ncbi:MAG: FkbM family methyltransferase [Ignavibacteria bacterium]|nr:FkbM family methyltransferase [Ignavibacteria bacterium]
MKKLIFNVYRRLFANKLFSGFNRYLYTLSLKGLGVNNYESEYYSGESYFLNRLKINKNDVIFDVGANVGNYANHIQNLFPESRIFSFEPHPKIFVTLKDNCKNIDLFNFGFGNEEKELLLYDYKEEAEGSEHASLYKDVFDKIYKKETTSFNIKIRTIDNFVKENNIENITLLKTDTEGNDFAVLQGAKDSINNNIIDIIHFEFNSMNTSSRIFFKDFFYYLQNYNMYRLLPKGVIKIDNYEPVYNEIFGYQNIVSIRKGSSYDNLFA